MNIRNIALSITLVLLTSVSALAGTATLSWDPPTTNTDGTSLTDLAGYKVYYGTASASYTQVVDVGLTSTPATPQYIVNNLTEGQTYFFAVTAYDTSGNESGYSSEVSKTIPLLPSYTLTVTKAGTGSGTVTSSPTGINCGTDCSEPYTNGTPVSLTAFPATGSTFAGWSGDADCTDGSVTMTASKTCTATFNLQAFTLSTAKAGTGSGTVTSSPIGINCGTDCSEPYNSGTVVTLTATPATGSTFTGWSGDADCTDGSVTMTASKTCTATFALPLDTTAPTISGISTSNLTSTGVTIAWTTNEASDTQIEYGTTTGYGSFTTLVSTLVTTHVQSLSNLSPSTLYHFRVRNRDAAGNLSISGDGTFFTSATSGTTQNLKPAQDTFLDINTTVNGAAPTLNTYTWPDFKIANAILMKFDLSSIPVGASILKATLNLSLVKSDTTTDPTYTMTVHKIINKNPVLAKANGYTFDGTNRWTANTCCYNNIPLAQADISAAYDTKIVDKVLGYKSWDMTRMVQEWINNPSANFGLLLNSDPTKFKNRYRTFASAENPNPALHPYLSINYTLSDTTPPTISGISTSNLTSSGVTISWTTNEASDTQIEYGTTTGYGNLTTLVSTLVTTHVQSLSDLFPSTLYHFRVRSRDAAGNLALSGDFAFATLAPPDTTAPLQSSIQTTGITATSATIQWNTNEPADSQVEYGPSTSYGSSTTLVLILGTSHSHVLTGLSPQTLYHYRVRNRDAAGNLSISGDGTFFTSATSDTTQNLKPAQDTFLDINTDVNSSATTLNAYTWPDFKIANAILMKFDLSGIPVGASILKATLNLSLVRSDTTTDPSYSITVHKIINKNPNLAKANGYTFDGTNSWTANTCCYNNIPLAQADISAAYDTKIVDKVLGYKSWDATAMVQEWINNPSTNLGLLLNSDPTKLKNRYRIFASKENTDANLHPYLTITYSP